MELNKKNILFLFIILLFFCFDNNITALEIRIDLSAMDGSASGNWNTISLANANLTTSNLKNYTDGAASSISITGSGWNGEWHGTIPAGYWFDGGAGMGDRLYCSTGSASFTFSNLGTSTYSVEILSEGDATVNYLTVNSSSASRSNLGNTVYPWNQGNSNDWLIWDSVTPSAGQITISISVQSGTYLNMDLIRIVQLITAPAAPTSNAASNISPTSFLANWNTVGDATGYKLDVSTVNTFASFVTGYQDLNVGKVTSYRVSGLNASTTYYYRVRAYNTVGTSANSGTQSTATTTAATEKQEFTYTGSDQTWTAPANVRQVYVQAWGAGGGKSGYSTSYAGGSGGYSSGTVPVSPGQTYTIVVGQGGIGLGVGSGGTAGGSATYGGGGYGTMGDASGASGGGLSGFFMGNSGMTFDASGQARAFIIAGGGGGSTGYAGGAGAGGGTTGGAGAATGGNGGTQSAGGTGTAGADGSALCGGNGSSTGFQASGSSDGGGGGGGYWGGEGGYDDAKPGGGGSGYLHGTIIGGQTTQGTQGPTSSEATPPNTGNSDYLSTAGVGAYGQVSTASGANGGHGLVVLSWTPKIIDQNLLTNAGAESGTLDSWTIIENGGNGWTVYENGIGGNYLFATSHLWCKKSQTIDLIAKGYTAAELDSVPKIYVECWVGQRMPQDIFKFYVSLKNGSLTEITSYNTGEIATPANWTKYSYTFTGYGSGLRYIHFENWGEDGSLGWAGYYGTFFDNELVMLDNAWNDVPYIMLQGKISYTEQSGTTAVFANAVVRDIDSTNFNGGSLIIGFDSGTGNIYDSFSIRHQGTGAGEIGVSGNNVSYNGVTFATFSGGSTGTDTLIVYLNANSGADTVEALLKNILYQNRSDAPDTKYLRVQLNDGGAETAQYIQTISFILVNDSPVLTLSDSISVIMGSETTMLFNASHISDSDASDSISNISLIIFDTDIVRITVDTGTGIDTFHFNAIGTAAGADTVIVKIIDRTGAFDTKTFVVNVFAAPYTGTKWYVSNDTGSNIFNNGSETFPFKTITKALSSVNTNDSVFVFAGTYNETVVITQNGISIIGADSGLTIIDPIGDSTVTTLYGIYANGLNNLRIANLKIFDCYSGIYFDNIDTSVIENIFIQNCGKNGGSGIGVYLTNGSCSNTISNCYVFKNYYGICVNNSAYNLLYGNSVISNQFYGIYAYNGSSFNYFSNNRSDSNNTGIYTYQNSDTNTFISNFVNYNQGHGIRLDSNNGCNILTNNVSNYNNNHGISVNGFNNIIQNNIANYNTWAGFNFTASSNNLFETNTASNNLQNGFQFANASNNIFKNNVSKSNNQSGFVLGSNFNNNIFIGNSSIANNERGFYLDNVSSNYFAQNDIKNNTGYQIYLLNSSTSDTFIKNNIQTSMINPNYAVCNSAASIFDMKYNYYNTTDSSVISSKINIAGGSILWLPFRTSEIDTFSGADTVAPEAPSFISSDTSVLKQVTLRWTKPVLDENGGALTGLTGYRIYRAGASQCRANGDTDNWELFFIFSTENVNDTEYTDTGFNATGTYYYRIVAFDSHSTNGQLFYNRSWYSGGIQVYARYNSAPETPVLLTPVNLPVPYTEYATYGRTLNQKPTLIWRCPADADSNALYFLIYFDSGFGLTLLANSANDTRGFYYYKSGSYDTFSSGGADSSVYGNTVYYNPQINLSDSLYMWTVIAYDSDLYSDTANLRRFKIGGRTWTDGTITAGTTLIRKIHIDELREEIDFARKLRGLSAFSWTDPVITAGETLIRKIHLDELRAASEQTAASGFYSIPVWTEPAITSGQTLIRKIFYDELRQKLTGF